MKTLMLLAIVLSPATLLAQESRLGTGGSAAQWRDSMDATIAWRDAKKISLLEPIPDLPQPQQGESLDPDTFAKGQIGKLSYWNFKVADVVDDKNMILALGTKHRIWLEGYPTDGMVDDRAVRVVDYVEIKGTKSYDTVLGAKTTVWIVKLLPKEETAKRLGEDLEFRDWHSKNGNTVNGKFLDLKNAKVVIEQRNGKKVSFPVSALIDADHEIAMQLAKERKENKKPPTK
jgi:hypothetical protein